MRTKKFIVTVLAMLMTLTTGAAEFITDIMVIGGSESETNELWYQLVEDGWKGINCDLNKGCGKSSDYIYMLYKTASNDDGYYHDGYITHLYITTDATEPIADRLLLYDDVYTLVRYNGSDEFRKSKGDLNSGTGGTPIHLYASRKPQINNFVLTEIYFNTSSTESTDDDLYNFDLNMGAGGDYIYMHANYVEVPVRNRFVSDLMLVGGSSEDVKNTITPLLSEGWETCIDDLNNNNDGDIVHLLYKTDVTPEGVNLGYVTDLYIKQGTWPIPDELEHDGRTYHIVPYAGGDHFVGQRGDLNSGTGENSDAIHLYYTKDDYNDKAINGLVFNADANGALGKNGDNSVGYSLNSGTGGAPIYIHISTEAAKTSKMPVSCLDACDVSGNGIRIAGWAYDPDLPDRAIKIQAEVRRADGTLYKEWPQFETDVNREDVNITFYILGHHGFDFMIPIKEDGTYTVSVYAIDIQTGRKVQVGSTATLTVTVKYDLWIGDTQVTWANKDNILNQTDNDGQPTAEFSDWDSSLTLRNPIISGTHMNSKIYTEINNLYVDGNYHMTEADADYGMLIDNCSNVEFVGGFTFHGRATGISVKNGACLHVEDYRSYSYLKAVGDSDYGVDGNLQICPVACGVELQGGRQAWNGSTLTLTNREDDYVGIDIVNGIYKDNQFYEADGTTIARHAVLKPYAFYNLWLGSTQVTEKNQNDILGDGKASYAPDTQTLTLNNPTISGTHDGSKIYSKDLDLTLKGNYHMSEAESLHGIHTSYMYSSDRSLTLDGNFTFLGTQIGLYGDRALVIMKSGSLTAKGADLDGVLSKGFVVENGVELVEMEGQGSSALSCFDGGVLTLADGYAITSPQGGLFKDEDIYESDGTTKARYVIIENKNSANPYMAYDVWLGNKHVNTKNKADIFGDGKASFDPETNTLTLNNPVIPGISYDSKIYSMLPSLTVKGSYHMTTAETIYALREKGGTLTLDGDFTLKGAAAHIGGGLTIGSPVYAKGDITLNGNINVEGTEDYSAIYSEEASINILGGNITSTSTAGCALLCANGTLTVNSNTSSVTLQVNTGYKPFVANVFNLGEGLTIVEPANWEFSSELKTIIDTDLQTPVDRVVIIGNKPGDANSDGNVDAVDITDIVNYMMGKPTSTGDFKFGAADVNGDNAVNAADIVINVNTIMSK